MAEAAAQFQKGLDQLALLPDNPERQRQELELCSALGAVLRAVKGNAAPETGRAFAGARELWEQLGSPSEFLHVPYLQSRYHVYRGELDLALRLDEDLLRLSRQRNDSVGLVLGHTTFGLNLLSDGKFALARSKTRLHSAIRSLPACLSIRWEFTPTDQRTGSWELPFSVSAFPTRHWRAAAKQSLRLGGWPTRRLWLRV